MSAHDCSAIAPPHMIVSQAKCALMAQRLLGACGVGRMALVGVAPPALCRMLRMASVDLRERSDVPDELDESALMDGAPHSVVLVSSCLVPTEAALAHIWPVAKTAQRTVAMILLGDAAQYQLRTEWERAFIAQGFRKHPRVEVVAAYESLDSPTDLMMLLFEPMPDEAVRIYPLEVLIAERDLHTDMTREPGRRSDAHMVRYAQAAQFVCPGDRVLDVACGLGYGSHILANTSRAASLVGLDASEYAVKYATVNFADTNAKPMSFCEGDAENLSFLSDGSIDFAVSVETLEHLYHPELLLGELMRVLTPGGRAYVSVPNNWADETGNDPNPFHHHVYDWPVLSTQLKRRGFVIERSWTQDAGGGQRLHDASRAIREFDPEQGPEQDGRPREFALG